MNENLKAKALEAMGFVYSDKDISPICTKEVRNAVLHVIADAETEIQQLKKDIIKYKMMGIKDCVRADLAEAKVEAAKTKEQKYREWLEKNTFSRNIDSDDSISPSNVYIETTNDALSKFKEVFSEGPDNERGVSK